NTLHANLIGLSLPRHNANADRGRTMQSQSLHCPNLAESADALPRLDIDPYTTANLLDPYPMHEMLREAGPVVWLTPYRIYACARYDEVKAVLSDHETFISGAGVGLTNFNLEKPF